MITSETRGASTPARCERGHDRDLAELVGRQAGERAIERADRRARRAYDDDVVLHHGNSFSAQVAAVDCASRRRG